MDAMTGEEYVALLLRETPEEADARRAEFHAACAECEAVIKALKSGDVGLLRSMPDAVGRYVAAGPQYAEFAMAFVRASGRLDAVAYISSLLPESQKDEVT